MSTAEINAYLDWRAEREGKTVDVSPEAYERHCIIQDLFDAIHGQFQVDDPDNAGIGELYNLVRMYELLVEEN